MTYRNPRQTPRFIVSANVPGAIYDGLNQAAEQRGLTRSELVRHLIGFGLALLDRIEPVDGNKEGEQP
jgi:hypothetical protein